MYSTILEQMTCLIIFDIVAGEVGDALQTPFALKLRPDHCATIVYLSNPPRSNFTYFQPELNDPTSRHHAPAHVVN